jgi:hypothetical protein
MKKIVKKLVFMVLLALLMASIASAAYTESTFVMWNKSVTYGDWTTATNWSPNIVPDGTYDAGGGNLGVYRAMIKDDAVDSDVEVYISSSDDISVGRLDMDRRNKSNQQVTVYGTLLVGYYEGSGLNGQLLIQAGGGYSDPNYPEITSTLLVDGGTATAEKGYSLSHAGIPYIVVDNGGEVYGQCIRMDSLDINGAGHEKAYVQIIDGLVDVGSVNNLSGDEEVQIGLDGVLKVSGNVDFTDLINDGYVVGAFGATGVDFAYDSGEGKTSVWGVPEPATIYLLGLSGLLLRRKKNA